MDFKKYPSIQNKHNEKFYNLLANNYSNSLFIVEEKVHGTNLGVYLDEVNILYASRNEFLNDNDNFFNFQLVKNKYNDKFRQIYRLLKDNIDVNEVIFYGELFGGYYPEKKNDNKRIQKGVYYTNDIEFYLFDIKIDGNKLRKSLGAVDWARKTCQMIHSKQVKSLKKSRNVDFLKQKQQEIYGRMSSVVKQIDGELKIIVEAQKIMKDFPEIPPMGKSRKPPLFYASSLYQRCTTFLLSSQTTLTQSPSENALCSI